MPEDRWKRGITTKASEPVTKADLAGMKTEIIEAEKDTVKGLAPQETVSAVLETVGETKEYVTKIKGYMKEKMEELTATHEDVRSVRNTVTMLAQSDAAHEAVIESLRKRLERVERRGGIAKQADQSHRMERVSVPGVDPHQPGGPLWQMHRASPTLHSSGGNSPSRGERRSMASGVSAGSASDERGDIPCATRAS